MTNPKRAEVLMMFIHAGGAGKTSTARDVGVEMARRGFKMLLIDLDPQGNLSEWLGVFNAPIQHTLVEALKSYDVPLPEPMHLSEFGLDLVPTVMNLAQTEHALAAVSNPEGRLKRIVEMYRDAGYDYIIIDAPPSLGKLTANAINATDWLIIPLPASWKGISATSGATDIIREYRHTNPGLKVAMYLVTQVNPTKVARDVIEKYRNIFGNTLVEQTTYRPAVYGECQAQTRPIGPKDVDAYQEVRSVTDALLERIGAESEVRG